MSYGPSPVNVPIDADICYTKSVTIPGKCDYLFLSASNSFTIEPDITLPVCWSSSSYTFPTQLFAFYKDLQNSGFTATISANTIILKDVSCPISASNLSSYFSAFNCQPSSNTSQTIKTFFTPLGNIFFLNLDTGEVYNNKGFDWAVGDCPHEPVANLNLSVSGLTLNSNDGPVLSAINNKLAAFGSCPGGYVNVCVSNSTHVLSGGIRRLSLGQSFTIPTGIYHTLDIVLLSGGTVSINNFFQLSIDDTQGQRSKSYQSSQYGSNNFYIPALTISALSGTPAVMWDGLQG